ncbi:uncharacterized protein MKK02DRAFT_41152 [Dioszegia hungarica]|uniref:Arrestin C-terminal-like domain-containing protein n=1 Tax=Dioszegia hungarica TaxID=4972 RepID=A0AA38H365_9TREE|nr:uncharacterized protein MKK02DRAFT_41152 [Dioszegia hungarica]KAI9632841.1 hypothetical protein MKK02DRAFT_41152 [Dioszegia hungarica]
MSDRSAEMSTSQLVHRLSTGSGLGISNASLSPPSVSTTQVSTDFIVSPPTSPSRPLPSPRAYQQQASPSKASGSNHYQPKVALRPTHHRGASSKGFASFSALAPSPTRSSPLRSRPEDRQDGSIGSGSGSRPENHRGESADSNLRRNLSNASASTIGSRIKKSRSSELLRRLSARGHETISGGKYQPLSGDDGEREEAEEATQPERRPSRERSHTVSTISAHAALSPQTHEPSPSDSGHHFMPTSFPDPPYRPDSSYRPSSHHPPPSAALARSQSQPPNGFYPDGPELRYSADPKRISDPSTGIHSQNHALFVAEKGGKMLAYSADGIWSANSIASTPPVGSLAQHPQHPQPRLTMQDDEDLKARPWSYSTETHQHHRPPHVRSLSEGATLARYGTLLHPGSGGQRASTELGIMLGNKSRRLSQGKLLPPPELEAWKATGGAGAEKVKLEAARKRRARVEVDVVLERECVVEGGEVRGRMEIRVNGSKSEGLRVGGGKVRVVGYEDISPQSRHIFYHHPHPLPLFAHPPIPNGPVSSLFASHPDNDGFREVSPGTHFIPFCMRLPLAGGAKGAYTSPSPKGPSVRYVVVGSVKLLHPKTGKRSIAHFYRPIVILPYLNPGIVLAPCEEMVEVVERRGLGWSLGGAKGVVELRVALGRDVWVSGQRVWCEVGVRNESSKRIKRLTLALLQTVQTFLPDNDTAAVSTDKDGIPNADEALGIASTFRRKVAEESIMADEQDHGGGRVTGKNWWTGVEAGEMGGWDLSLLIPNGLLTIPRSRLVEVTYTLRLTANSSTNLFVDVPVTLINFLSIDPPPMPGDGARFGVRNAQAVPIGQYASHPVASTAGGPYGAHSQDGSASLHSGEGPARASSTTLHIDALLSAGRARADAEAAANYPEHARSRQPRPISTISEYNTPDVFGQSHGHGHGTPLGGWANRASLPMPGGIGAGMMRPKGQRMMSYLSARSSQQDHPLSEEDEDEEIDIDVEADRLLLAAARREGRKMSLAALTRAAEREADDYMHQDRDDLLSPTRETPPTGTWFPTETPYEEGFKVLGETPSMRSRSVGSPAPVPTIGSGRTRRSSKAEEADEMRRLERLTIAEEQEALASTRGSSDDHHYGSASGSGSGEEHEGGGGYADHELRAVDPEAEVRLAPPITGTSAQRQSRTEHRRSHEVIPEEEEPEEEDTQVGNETVLEDLVAPHEDDTLRMTLPSHAEAGDPSEDAFEYSDEIERSPDPALLGSLNSTSGTGNTASSLRVPSRSGSALDTMLIRSVDSEREAHIQQTRSLYGSFAASAVSEQDSEVGQVTEAVKRNLSIKTPSRTMRYRQDDDGVEGDTDEDKLSPTRALNIPRSGSAPFGMAGGGGRKFSHTPSPEKRASAAAESAGISPKMGTRYSSAPNIQGLMPRRESSSTPVAPSPLRDTTTLAPSSIGRVFANRPSFSFNAPGPNRDREVSQSPRGGNTYSLSPGPSPRSGFPDPPPSEPMQRQLSAQSSQLRNQVRVRPPSEELPQLAPSVASDSGSSEGHGLESPPIASNPAGMEAVILHDPAGSRLSGGADKPLPSDPAKSTTFNPVLDPNWLPAPHHLHTQVAFARTSFSAPDPHAESPRGKASRKESGKAISAGDHSVYSHEDETYASHAQHGRSRPTSPSGTSHSSHAPMPSGMQSRLKQLEARDEALRKFSVASAASGQGGGQGYERERQGSGQVRGSVGGYERERAGSGLVPRGSVGTGYERERVASIPTHAGGEVVRRESNNGGNRNSAPAQEVEAADKVVRKRRSYTAALGARPVRSASDDIIDKPTATTPALGGTTYITRRPFGASPPPMHEAGSTGFGWQSPPRLEVSFSPPSRPSAGLQRNLSASSVSTTATTIEAALASRRPAGPRATAPRTQVAPSVDPYENLQPSGQAGGYAYSSPAYNVYGGGGGGGGAEQADLGRYLAPGQTYGADAYGSEQGSVRSKASARGYEWAEPQRSWTGRGSQGTDDSEGLL